MMIDHIRRLSFALAALALPGAAGAADYVAIELEVAVERPAEHVWKTVGDYCAIRDWLKVSCAIASGTGGVGTVRVLADGATIEPMVAKTAHSYTYVQTKGRLETASYHGTLAVESADRSGSRLKYILFYDAATFPSDEVREAEYERLSKRFTEALMEMKRISER